VGKIARAGVVAATELASQAFVLLVMRFVVGGLADQTVIRYACLVRLQALVVVSFGWEVINLLGV